MSDARKILMRLAVLAEQCGEKISEARTEFYLERLTQYPVDQVAKALEALIETAKKFPTIAEIKQTMGVETAMDPRAKATVIAQEIWGVLERGAHRESIARSSVEARWCAEKLGGWTALSAQATYDAKPALMAQWRDMVIGYVPQLAAGAATALPPAETPTRSLLGDGCCLPTVIDMNARRDRR